MRRERRIAFRRAMSVALSLTMTAGLTFTNAPLTAYAAETSMEQTTEGKAENSAAEEKAAGEKAAEENTAGETTAKEKTAEEKTDEEKSAEEKKADEHTSGGEMTEADTTENRTAEGKKEDKASEKRAEEDAKQESLEEMVENTAVRKLTAAELEDGVLSKEALAEEKIATDSELLPVPEKRFDSSVGNTAISEIKVPALAEQETSVSFVWGKPENYADIMDYKVYEGEIGEEHFLGTASDNYKENADWANAYREAFYKEHSDAVKISIHSFTAKNLKPDTEYRFIVVPVTKDHVEHEEDAAEVSAHTTKKLEKDEIHNITDYGAKAVEEAYTSYNDAINLEIEENTKAIQAAIDDCGPGEKVVIPEGIFMSGALYLHSDMTLELEKGAVLEGSPNVDHYDQNYILYPYSTDTRSWSLVNVYTADEEHPYQNIRIVGEGTIDGNGWPEISKMKQDGDATEEKYVSPQYVAGGATTVIKDPKGKVEAGILAKDATKNAALRRVKGEEAAKNRAQYSDAEVQAFATKVDYNTRPSLIMIRGTENFYIEGVTLKNPAYHTLAVLDSNTVTSNNVKYLTYDCNNGDGIEIGNTENAIIFNSFFDTGDDAVNFATGMGKAVGDTAQHESKNIWTFDNVFRECHGGAIAAGSHTGAGIEDMLVEDNVLNHSDMPFRFKSAPANGGFIRNVKIRDCAVAECDQLFVMTTMYSDSNGVSDTETADTPAEFSRISAYNISCDGTNKNSFSLIADVDNNDPSKPKHRHHDLYFQDITVKNSVNYADEETKNGKTSKLAIDKIKGEVLDGIEDATFYNVRIHHTGDNKVWNKIVNCQNLRFYDEDSAKKTESALTKDAETKPVWSEDAELRVIRSSESAVASPSELSEASPSELSKASSSESVMGENGFTVKLKFDAAKDYDTDGEEKPVDYIVETYVDNGAELVDIAKLVKEKTEIVLSNLSAGVDYLFKVYAVDRTGNRSETALETTYTIEAENPAIREPEDKTIAEASADVYTSLPIKVANARLSDPRIRGYKIYVDGKAEPKVYYNYQLGSKKYSSDKKTVTLIADRLTEGEVDKEKNRKTNTISVVAFTDAGDAFRYDDVEGTTWQMYDFHAPVIGDHEIQVERKDDAFELSWSPAEDESGIVGYRVYVDGKPVYGTHGNCFNHVNGAFTTEKTNYTVTGLDLTKPHHFAVTAGDNWWRAKKNEAPYHWSNDAAEADWTPAGQTDPENPANPENPDTPADPGTSENHASHASDSSASDDHDDRHSSGNPGHGSYTVLGNHAYSIGQGNYAYSIDHSHMGFWGHDAAGWTFRDLHNVEAKDGWYQCEYNHDVEWYHFDATGHVSSGWYQDQDGNVYYLYPAHDGKFGQMVTGWQTIDGKRYYFEERAGQKQGHLVRSE